jgi:sucrose-6-phosphate hydrolase SacC (GH32 family)
LIWFDHLTGQQTRYHTGVIDPQQHQVQNLGYSKNLSDPYLCECVKPNFNPLISPVDGINSSLYRDLKTAGLGPDNQWRILVGSKQDSVGKIITYKSSDFVKWTGREHTILC